jgi:hypothetical protein
MVDKASGLERVNWRQLHNDELNDSLIFSEILFGR